jgi:hypothetical protein
MLGESLCLSGINALPVYKHFRDDSCVTPAVSDADMSLSGLQTPVWCSFPFTNIFRFWRFPVYKHLMLLSCEVCPTENPETGPVTKLNENSTYLCNVQLQRTEARGSGSRADRAG